MKIIEEPIFRLDNRVGFDALVEREMEVLEGGIFNTEVFFSDVSTTTTSTSTSTSTTSI